jgi:hypothetical protein
MVITQKFLMILVDMGRAECKCIMGTTSVTKGIINYRKIMGHDDCLKIRKIISLK